MELNRRSFLGVLAAGLALDPERMLWCPGAKLISIPKPRPLLVLNVGDVFTIAGRYLINPITERETDIPQRFVVTSMYEGPDDYHYALNTYPMLDRADIGRKATSVNDWRYHE